MVCSKFGCNKIEESGEKDFQIPQSLFEIFH